MPVVENENQYSTITGVVYVFNLIVGTGALALPGAFFQAGWILGAVIVCILGLLSLVTVTFVLEALSVVNGINHLAIVKLDTPLSEDGDEESTPLLSEQPLNYEIVKKFEISEMATLLLSKPMRVVVFTCLVLYLLGDLSIYIAVVAKTLAHVTCVHKPANFNCNETLPDTLPCWDAFNITRADAYKIYACIFVAIVGPFTFFNIQKTKFLQVLTSGMRSLAFAIMIAWSIQKLVVNGRQGYPVSVNIYAVPTLFGTCVYSFMCQHSIPGLVQPIANKLRLKKLLTFDYLIISVFYILLSMTAVFTFRHVEDLYTLNFWSDMCNQQSSNSIMFLDYYLALFPVFTLSTSFPIIAITLKNNLMNIFAHDNQNPSNQLKIVFALVTCLVPMVLALVVSNLQTLVGVIGAYAGAGVQYLIPCILVSATRSHVILVPNVNPFASPFKSHVWVIALYFWMTISLILITVHYVTDLINYIG